jgi:hypothetical protein
MMFWFYTALQILAIGYAGYFLLIYVDENMRNLLSQKRESFGKSKVSKNFCVFGIYIGLLLSFLASSMANEQYLMASIAATILLLSKFTNLSKIIFKL